MHEVVTISLFVVYHSWRQFVSVVLDTGLKLLSFFLKVWLIPLHNFVINVFNCTLCMDDSACTEKPWWSSGDKHHPFNSGVLYVKRKVGACSYVDDPIGSQSLLSRAMHKVCILLNICILPFSTYPDLWVERNALCADVCLDTTKILHSNHWVHWCNPSRSVGWYFFIRSKLDCFCPTLLWLNLE